MNTYQETRKLAQQIRSQTLKMVHRANASHVGSCLSIADLLAVLYGQILKIDPANPNLPERDRFILSKGHATAILYAVLAERGFFPLELLETYCQDGSLLTGHV
ncbi:MAG: transketolase, partial [Planktothrix sp.]